MNKPLLLLDKNKIKNHLKNKSISIDIFETIGSTNDYLQKNIDDQKLQVCVAEMQTQGRGRLGKIWHSPFGQNVYLSMRYRFKKDISELSGLSLVVALAVTHAIESLTSIKNIKIKWPNDLFIDHKKVAGILIELQAKSDGFCHAIIGIGINVNMETANKNQIDQAWDSLKRITGHYIDRNHLCAILINSLLNYLERFSNSDLSCFVDEWKQKDFLFNQPIVVLSGANKFSGIASGINTQGHLLLTMSDKIIRTFSSGDTSILK